MMLRAVYIYIHNLLTKGYTDWVYRCGMVSVHCLIVQKLLLIKCKILPVLVQVCSVGLTVCEGAQFYSAQRKPIKTVYVYTC